MKTIKNIGAWVGIILFWVLVAGTMAGLCGIPQMIAQDLKEMQR